MVEAEGADNPYIDDIDYPTELFGLSSTVPRNINIAFWHEDVVLRQGFPIEAILLGRSVSTELELQAKQGSCRRTCSATVVG